MILHITSNEEWEKARLSNEYTAPSLNTEGFIHCSTLKQVVDTANVFYKGQDGLVLLCIDETKLKSKCKYESPTGGDDHNPDVGNFFPHVYGPINISAITIVLDFPVNSNGKFSLPVELKDIK
jgi:uncharacterized protein (DUF952 family)